MKNISLKKKIILMVFTISLICPAIAGFIIYRNSLTIGQFQVIAEKSLPRTRKMGKVLATFKEMRIQFRSLAIRNLSPEEVKIQLNKISSYVKDFEESKNDLIKLMSTTAEEKKMADEFEASWRVFLAFGEGLILLAEKGDPVSLDEIALRAKTICPDLAKKLEDSVFFMIDWQDKKVVAQTVLANETNKDTVFFSILIAAFAMIGSITGGVFFSMNLVNNLTQNVLNLSRSSMEIFNKSNEVANISSDLSEAATEQAASLEQTVVSIDEISAMISRNSETASSSTTISENSTKAAQKGKEKVEEMMDSISAISQGNDEIIDQMRRSNGEISEIVKLINDISLKTQVINDIVFQTKLLSFNASVEAARAGEHGKGFAVVAEEVGNLASMSGKAATEISDILGKSVKRVTDIVDGTKVLMENMIKQSKSKVDQGNMTAKECAVALDEILSNVSSVNEMIREISTASQEQATGVREVNHAMSQLDRVTQQNSLSAQSSSQAATYLNDQVENLKSIVSGLSNLVDGVNHSREAVSIPQNIFKTNSIEVPKKLKKVS